MCRKLKLLHQVFCQRHYRCFPILKRENQYLWRLHLKYPFHNPALSWYLCPHDHVPQHWKVHFILRKKCMFCNHILNLSMNGNCFLLLLYIASVSYKYVDITSPWNTFHGFLFFQVGINMLKIVFFFIWIKCVTNLTSLRLHNCSLFSVLRTVGSMQVSVCAGHFRSQRSKDSLKRHGTENPWPKVPCFTWYCLRSVSFDETKNVQSLHK